MHVYIHECLRVCMRTFIKSVCMVINPMNKHMSITLVIHIGLQISQLSTYSCRQWIVTSG